MSPHRHVFVDSGLQDQMTESAKACAKTPSENESNESISVGMKSFDENARAVGTSNYAKMCFAISQAFCENNIRLCSSYVNALMAPPKRRQPVRMSMHREGAGTIGSHKLRYGSSIALLVI